MEGGRRGQRKGRNEGDREGRKREEEEEERGRRGERGETNRRLEKRGEENRGEENRGERECSALSLSSTNIFDLANSVEMRNIEAYMYRDYLVLGIFGLRQLSGAYLVPKTVN